MSGEVFTLADKFKIDKHIIQLVFIGVMNAHSTRNSPVLLFPDIACQQDPDIGLGYFDPCALFSIPLMSGADANGSNWHTVVRGTTSDKLSVVVTYSMLLSRGL